MGTGLRLLSPTATVYKESFLHSHAHPALLSTIIEWAPILVFTMPVFCDFCGVSFRTDNALHQHCRDRADHPYCEECERVFKSFNGLSQVR